jgi:hypothetical protein
LPGRLQRRRGYMCVLAAPHSMAIRIASRTRGSRIDE